jgi:DNA-binding NarL/FixJ family response regulator
MTAAAATVPRYAQPTTVRLIKPWTDRQREIAEGIASNMGYIEIGLRLGITSRTVRAHVEQMARNVHGLDAEVPPRMAVWLYMRLPDIVEGIISAR